jgi:hypothetical protein
MYEAATDEFEQLRTPIVLVCPFDGEHKWFKAMVGLKPITKADRESRLNCAESGARLRQCDASNFRMARANGLMEQAPPALQRR